MYNAIFGNPLCFKIRFLYLFYKYADIWLKWNVFKMFRMEPFQDLHIFKQFKKVVKSVLRITKFVK